ncbi:MAG: NAD(P)H-dependent oxidoreductase [Bacteroidetes bacterium]|nr:NAD(P)H-dependent oxidoreductase [Bacteroidota bacterium]
MDLIKAMNWRYATKRMNGIKVPPEKVDRILEATRLSPSSFGLQPYTILVIEDHELRKKIQPAAYNQPQIAEASHLLVFAVWENITTEKVSEFISHVAEMRGIPADTLKDYQTAIESKVIGNPPEATFNWAARQAYLALGTAVVAAAVEEVDATPMEGFDPHAVDTVLHLKAKGLRSVALLTLGYRDTENDSLVRAKKVRREKEKLFVTLP